MHAVVFWLTVSLLTPFVLLVGLFNDRRRLLHDMLVGTVVINTPARADALRATSSRCRPTAFPVFRDATSMAFPFDDCAAAQC